MGGEAAPLGAGLVFRGDDGVSGAEPWFSDGTAAGTTLLADIQPGPLPSSPHRLVPLAGGIAFVASGPVGTELYFTTGITATLLADVSPPDSPFAPLPIGAVGNRLLVAADTMSDVGTELAFVDATGGGGLLVDIDDRVVTKPSNPAWFARLGDRALFVADDGVHGQELWVTDGTEAGTTLVRDLFPGPQGSVPRNLFEFGGRLYFSAVDAQLGGGLWVTDGTAAGTALVVDIHPNGGGVSSDVEFVSIGDRFVFVAGDPTHGVEPWVSDGTAAGTHVIDLAPGPVGSMPGPPHAFQGRAYFPATRADVGSELFVTDGTVAGTTLFLDIAPGPTASSDPSTLRSTDDRLFFFAATPSAGREPWVSDGSPANTTMIIDLTPGPSPSVEFSSPMEALEDVAIFASWAGSTAEQLWRSDGTPQGTVPLGNGNPSLQPIDYVDMVVGRSTVTARLKAIGVSDHLITTDGSLVTAVSLGPQGLVKLWKAGSDDTYLVLLSGDDGLELFAFDGPGTTLTALTDSNPGSASSSPLVGVRAGNSLVFSAVDATGGRELHAIPFIATGSFAAETYGYGCGGPAVEPPRLDAIGDAIPGASFGLGITDAPPNRLALLLLGPEVAATPLGQGCFLWVGGSPMPSIVVPTGPTGAVQVSGTVPGLASLSGVVARGQALIGGSTLEATTAGIEIVFGQ